LTPVIQVVLVASIAWSPSTRQQDVSADIRPGMRPSVFPGKTTACLPLVVTRTASLDFSGKRRPTRQNWKASYTTIGVWAGCCLEYLVLPVCDLENSRLALEPPDETGLEQATGSSIIYRNAIGPHQGHKACSSQTLLPGVASKNPVPG